MSVTIEYNPGQLFGGQTVTATAYLRSAGNVGGAALTFTEDTARPGFYRVAIAVGSGGLTAGFTEITTSLGDVGYVNIADGQTVTLDPSPGACLLGLGVNLTQIGGTTANGLLSSANVFSAAALASLLTTAMTESYAAKGAAPTLAQAIFLIQQSLHEFAITSTTRQVNKLDGTTQAAAFTLNSATAPTATTRSA